MAEFFLELFSEEIPAKLQKNARNELLELFTEFFEKKIINFKSKNSFSTPNRLIILFEGIKSEILQEEQELRGPKVEAPEVALEGFIRSNNISKKDLFKKKNRQRAVLFF